MNRQLSFVSGLGIGALASYALSPRNRRRVAGQIRNRVDHLSHVVPDKIDVATRDIANRTRGMVAEATRLVRHEDRVPNEVLVARVRSSLGRVVSHPHAVHVDANGGIVTLSGQILSNEVDNALRQASRVPGVTELQNNLEPHEEYENIPSLQGGYSRRAGSRFDIFQTNWSPATRTIVGTTGAGLTLYGLSRRDLLSFGAMGLGAYLVGRSFSRGKFDHGFQLRKAINIDAPVDEVYRFWSNFENFPKFMTDILEVKHTDERRSRWVVKGPLGAPVSWEAQTTENQPNRYIAWESLPNSVVDTSGKVKFASETEGGTRIEVEFCYYPPAGVISHKAAQLFGADPKKRIAESLGQMKQLLEQGPSVRQARRMGLTSTNRQSRQNAASPGQKQQEQQQYSGSTADASPERDRIVEQHAREGGDSTVRTRDQVIERVGDLSQVKGMPSDLPAREQAREKQLPDRARSGNRANRSRRSR